jgi:hypothetical protein
MLRTAQGLRKPQRMSPYISGTSECNQPGWLWPNEQDWLDGEAPPIDTTNKPPT